MTDTTAKSHRDSATPTPVRTSVHTISMGCRLNSFESEVMRRHAESGTDGPMIIINTCAVTQEAERQSRQRVRRAHRDNPDTPIVVTGCAAQLNPNTFQDLPGVARVLGNREKMLSDSFRFTPTAHPAVIVGDIMRVRETAAHLIDGFHGRTRAFIEVQQGCDHRCTFCIIPFARGPNRSVPAGAIVQQVRHLVNGGTQEVVLSGVDIASWGQDLPGTPSLGVLVRAILKHVPHLPRLRLSSLDPAVMDTVLWQTLAHEPRLMGHLHLSIQSLSDMVLKRMKRRHCHRDVVAFIRAARAVRADLLFGADIIAGFPTESDSMFKETYAALEELGQEQGLVHLHVFPYSERPKTPAARMPSVPKPVRKERAHRLRSLGERLLSDHLKTLIGQQVRVLTEQDGRGFDEYYRTVQITNHAPNNALLTVRIDSVRDTILYGKALHDGEPHELAP